MVYGASTVLPDFECIRLLVHSLFFFFLIKVHSLLKGPACYNWP